MAISNIDVGFIESEWRQLSVADSILVSFSGQHEG